MILKVPSRLVTVPKFVPLIKTLASGIELPSSTEIIFPLIFSSCAKEYCANKKHVKSKISSFLSTFLIMIAGVVFWEWWLLEMSALFLGAAILLGVIYVWTKESKPKTLNHPDIEYNPTEKTLR